MSKQKYTYDEIFQRNIGILSKSEQRKIKKTKILFVGCGGIGGWAAELLVRLGVGSVILADPEEFEVSNLNRQATSTHKTIGLNKADTLGRYLKEINPYLNLKIVTEGITKNNISELLDSTDFCVDTIDFYAIEDDIILHDAARRMEKKIFLAQVAGSKATFTYFDSNCPPLSHFITRKNKISMVRAIRFFFPELPKESSKLLINRIVRGQKAVIPSYSVKPVITASLLVEDIIKFITNNEFYPVPSIGIYDFHDRTYKRVIKNGR